MRPRNHELRTTDYRLRTGFTLVELLVVTLIIGILVALSASAVIRYVGVQNRNNSETVIRKVQPLLDAHYKSVVKTANKERIPQAILNLAADTSGGIDERRARVIYIKLRLRQEFPINFYEAIDPSPLSPITSYVQAVRKAFPTGTPTRPGGPTESAACLLLALHRAREGADVSGGDLGAISVLDTNGDGLQEIVDGWAQPIRFIRWPHRDAYLNPGGPQPGARNDQEDPEGLLTNQGWQGSGNKATFEGYAHPVPYTGAISYRLFPVIISGGPNRVMGIDEAGGLVGSANDSNDNLYNYNLFPLGARGD